ncbi:carbohydrate binding family 9 domain-containing protein [Kaistella sp. BT6-1-3]|uniref:Carbohydrate binding family 9 domain-containing protein n=1 Tax=Kaistella yananensis TaxID=2989820 RepID=A0ABT3JN25_9FLAO|nr:carbohydrate binding family 9 domain-containing protein [Kaistella yananensis]MCW4452084.1 carbohydrate binding family 9 domain-containing protein [Kaistella yananensis]
MKTRILSAFLILTSGLILSQNTAKDSISRKKATAVKITKSPKIDGILDEGVWENAPSAANFIERRPNNGKPAVESLKSEVKILYDDTGIYFGAVLFDNEPTKIAKELTERDNIENDDIFGVTLNGYNDHQQSLEFLVTPAGVQADAKLTNDFGEDFSWNAVWFSAVKITETGWVVEMKIPYSELRFPKKQIQEWGINILRLVNRTSTTYDWNFVDNKKGSYMLYDGVLNGIENINPPTRLSFLPYFSTYLNSFDGTTDANFNGGMDLKYGINDAFTLDLTLIPDFGQTSFDKSVLNLSPFEVQFQEQRPFFTEGTELFSKGNLFYSRRIGGHPSLSPSLNNDEEFVENPDKVKLFNAVKVSGRTNKGLGIGFFNAVTEKMHAEIRNINTGEIRKEVIEPWANYNVLVLDQRFGGNSSVSLVNTNVTRDGNFRDANVTALLFDVRNKKNTYRYFGSTKESLVMNGETKYGNESSAGFNKVSGVHRFGANYFMRTRDYDIGDLGYYDRTNFHSINTNYSYRYLQPKGGLNVLNYNLNISHNRRLDEDLFTQFVIHNSIEMQTKSFFNFGGGLMIWPLGENDIYEPRTAGRHLDVPAMINPWIFINTDNRKKFRINTYIDYYAFDEKGRYQLIYQLNPSYKFSDKLRLYYDANFNYQNHDRGFVGKDANDIFMGTRNRFTVENGISSQYTFNNKMALNLSFRHYFSEVTYKGFSTLNADGSVKDTNIFTENRDGTFNSWNVDLRYSWWFAPGSQLTLLYRNAVGSYLEESRIGIKENFTRLFNEPMVDNISLKLTYYIDYNQAKNWLKHKG